MGSRYLIAGVLLLAIFFLPLHLHSFTPTTQVSEECSCYYGARTELGSAPTPDVLLLVFQALLLAVSKTELPVEAVVEFESARAPPRSL